MRSFPEGNRLMIEFFFGVVARVAFRVEVVSLIELFELFRRGFRMNFVKAQWIATDRVQFHEIPFYFCNLKFSTSPASWAATKPEYSAMRSDAELSRFIRQVSGPSTNVVACFTISF